MKFRAYRFFHELGEISKPSKGAVLNIAKIILASYRSFYPDDEACTIIITSKEPYEEYDYSLEEFSFFYRADQTYSEILIFLSRPDDRFSISFRCSDIFSSITIESSDIPDVQISTSLQSLYDSIAPLLVNGAAITEAKYDDHNALTENEPGNKQEKQERNWGKIGAIATIVSIIIAVIFGVITCL